MLPESKNKIVKNFVTLMKECDVKVLKNRLVNDVFTQKELDKIFSVSIKYLHKWQFVALPSLYLF